MKTRKIRLSTEDAEAIEMFLEVKDGDISEAIDSHAQIYFDYDDSFVDGFVALNDISPSDLARALLNGYEVKLEYRVGDHVYVNWSNRDATIQRVVEGGIVDTSGDGDTIKIDWENNPYPPIGIIRHATKEEILHEKERHTWDKIRRKVGEFYEDDVGYGLLGTPLQGKEMLETYYNKGILSGFFPAESFVDLREWSEYCER